ncbi:GNAT family N-acetyltransferase [Gordonia asplenii]|uniref:GNAT family N-acetyltransferase n=1 Tax=Gordonia asplenii TaxID=2725283 RepID=UPI001B7D5698|nr:GNAT family N-acetyltransferase [Gordonia asplenii]
MKEVRFCVPVDATAAYGWVMAITLRRAVPDDALDVARVHVRAWQIGYAGLMPDDYLTALDPGVWARRYTFDVASPATTLAVDGDTVVGLATVSTVGEVGEVWALYVEPARWGSGIGANLLDAAVRHLRDAGFARAELWALRGNDRAARFYAAQGWTRDGRVREDVGQGGLVHVDECFVRGL